MNFIDACKAFLDGSARDAEIAEIKRVLSGVMDNPEQHAEDARDAVRIASSGQSPAPWYINVDGAVCASNGYEVGETDWTIADETKAIECVNRIGLVAEQHLVTVARLEAEGHALRQQVVRLEDQLMERYKTTEALRTSNATLEEQWGKAHMVGVDLLKENDAIRARLASFDRACERIVEIVDLGGTVRQEDIEPMRALLLEE